MIRSNSSSREHERAAVYHRAAVHAQEGTRALASRIDPSIAAIKAARRAREDAEDAIASALALRDVAAGRLDDAVRALAGEADAADRERPAGGIALRLFADRSAPAIGILPIEENLREVAKILERLAMLAEGEPLRGHRDTIGSRAEALQSAKAAHTAALQVAAAARVREDLAQLDLRQALGANRGTLIEMNHGDLREAARFFRGESRRANGKTNGVALTPANTDSVAAPPPAE